jgi:hypothetical protein
MHSTLQTAQKIKDCEVREAAVGPFSHNLEMAKPPVSLIGTAAFFVYGVPGRNTDGLFFVRVPFHPCLQKINADGREYGQESGKI